MLGKKSPVHYAAILVLLLALPWCALVQAQEKAASTWLCGKPDQVHSISAPDRPDHSFSVYRFRCTPIQPDQIGGLTAKSDEGTGSAEILGDRVRFRNVEVVTMDNGDKLFYTTTGTNIYKKGAFVSGEAVSVITGGTGRLKGIKGKVLSKGKLGAEGTIWEAETEYQLAK